jgi:1,4-alpha-glucan branching enzyme
MAASLDHVTEATPMGANLVAGGATFRVWAPRARQVYVCYEGHWDPEPDALLTMDPAGYWSGFMPGIGDGAQYELYVVGNGRTSRKRDPYARELTANPPDPSAKCVVRRTDSYPWAR